jgi:hypothetical protein
MSRPSVQGQAPLIAMTPVTPGANAKAGDFTALPPGEPSPQPAPAGTSNLSRFEDAINAAMPAVMASRASDAAPPPPPSEDVGVDIPQHQGMHCSTSSTLPFLVLSPEAVRAGEDHKA